MEVIHLGIAFAGRFDRVGQSLGDVIVNLADAGIGVIGNALAGALSIGLNLEDLTLGLGDIIAHAGFKGETLVFEAIEVLKAGGALAFRRTKQCLVGLAA